MNGALAAAVAGASEAQKNRYKFLSAPVMPGSVVELKNHPSSYMQHEMRQHEVTMASGEPVSKDRISELAKEVVVGAKSSVPSLD